MTVSNPIPFADDFLFTSESVTEGHPDKVADLVSDAVLDAVLTADSNPRRARVAMDCRAAPRPARRCRRATSRVTSKTSPCIARFVITARPSRPPSHVEAR